MFYLYTTSFKWKPAFGSTQSWKVHRGLRLRKSGARDEMREKGKKTQKTVISVRPFIRTSDPPAPVVSDQKGKRGQGGGRRRREKNIEIWWEQMEKRDREEGSDMRTDSEMGMEMERGEGGREEMR